MVKWLCKCGFTYDEKRGFPSLRIRPGTAFDKIESFSCPKCSSDKGNFEPIVEKSSHEEVPVVKAKYDRIKDWVMDPKGYFTIKPFPEEMMIKVRYYSADGKLQSVVEGKTAMEIYNTIVREGMVSSLQHAADLGAELMKSEICMKLKKEYVQDSPF